MTNTLDLNNESYLTLNGKRFHYLWLRDNCRSPKCLHPTAFEKIFDISDLQEQPKPLSVEIKDEKLIIDWDEEPSHQSVFSINWLLSHTYDRDKSELDSQYEPEYGEQQLWDKTWLEENLPKWHDADSCSYETLISQLSTYGFTLLRNLQPTDLENFLSNIGPFYYFASGEEAKIFTVKAIQNPLDLALSSEGIALKPHVDGSMLAAQPLVQFLYCLENEVLGGTSILVDGFRIAKDFKSNYPEYFQVLAETPIQFSYFDPHGKFFQLRSRPVIEINKVAKVVGFCFSHEKTYPWMLPFDEMENFYEAYLTLFEHVKNPDYQYRFRLNPGDLLLVQNFRILHGRTAYDASMGARELKVGYIGWDFFTAKWRFSKFKNLFSESEITTEA